MTGALYLDSSALVKLVVDEPCSDALAGFVADRDIVSSALAEVEVRRACRRAELENADMWRVIERAEEVLSRTMTMSIDELILRTAAGVSPAAVGSLDSIHVATALRCSLDVVTYDARMRRACEQAGLRSHAPGEA